MVFIVFISLDYVDMGRLSPPWAALLLGFGTWSEQEWRRCSEHQACICIRSSALVPDALASLLQGL